MEQAYYEIKSNFSPIYKIALALIRNRGYNELSNIISSSKLSVVNTEYDNWNGGTYGYTVYVNLSVKLYSSFLKEKISEFEKIFSDSLNEAIKGDDLNYFIVQISPSFCESDIDWDIIGGQTGKTELKTNIETVKNIMVSVATNGSRIQDEEDRYKRLNSQIKNCCLKLNITYNNSFNSLWDWYGKWKAVFPTYQMRRDYLNELFTPILDLFDDCSDPNSIVEQLIPLDDWERINRTIIKIKKDSCISKDEEDFQKIGLLCREVIISLAQTVYNPTIHGNIDTEGTHIGKTDANRMLNNYLTYKLSGDSNEELRKYAKDTNKLANLLTHKRNATKKDMLLTMAATFTLINFVGIIEEKFNYK